METNDSFAERPLWPFDLEADGIYYRHVKGTDEITVTSSPYDRCEYHEDFIIPRKVTYREREYRVTGIGKNAFGYSAVFSVEIPETVTAIGEDAFYCCTGLESISIPAGVKSIGDKAFSSCSLLKTIVLPESITEIGEALFRYCDRLESITAVPGNPIYTDIDGILFSKDKTMLIACPPGKKGSYSIPGEVTAIANSAFRTCSKLTSITIPAGVKSIGRYAFGECESLMEIRADAPVPPVCGKNAFKDIPKDCKLIVPESSKKSYREAAEWKNLYFKN
ncbi:MAG: leucine-rich repeat domain-containing protein [Candidatus Azobacteroides sp.]|nr:leucine-rich repeat domain-containing protein [Candidatus Azobacteroides sp.]